MQGEKGKSVFSSLENPFVMKRQLKMSPLAREAEIQNFVLRFFKVELSLPKIRGSFTDSSGTAVRSQMGASGSPTFIILEKSSQGNDSQQKNQTVGFEQFLSLVAGQ